MNQLSFSDIEYSNRWCITKRGEFLNSMDIFIPSMGSLDRKRSIVGTSLGRLILSTISCNTLNGV